MANNYEKENDMKVIQWNAARNGQPISGITRYEDELYNHMEIHKGTIDLERIRRTSNPATGNMVASWFLTYKPDDADIVHATFMAIAPAIYIRKPKRFIVTVHDLITLVYPSPTLETLQWTMVTRALRKADAIIAISEFTKKEIVRLLDINESKIHTVRHAAVKYRPMNKKECKQRLGLDTSEKHILVVASNRKHKRMDLTQKVFDDLRKRRKDIKLIKAGYAEKLSGEGIINTGWVSEAEMPILYNSADVFLSTSEYEGFGAPILEAMSCGVPVVVSNKASIPEVVGTYGNTIDLDAHDVIEQFVDKILSNINIGLDEKALAQSNTFSWEKTTEETMRVYDEIYKKLPSH